ncbi:MAG TPA: hypothetical protein VHA54_11850 [Solirubrobacterales bacterium]|nr:hypothetical protein [Solirubrobacterales bacterium]
MREPDLDRLGRLIAPLTRFFYALLGVALLAILVGSPGSALFFLVVGAAAQVLRAAIQELVWQREVGAPAPSRRPRPRRAGS